MFTDLLKKNIHKHIYFVESIMECYEIDERLQEKNDIKINLESIALL